MESLGERVRQVRENAGLGQADFAKRIGVVASKISKVESGEQELQVEQLNLLAPHFGTNLNWLITGQLTPGDDQVAEDRAEYKTRHNAGVLARELAKRPALAAAVRRVIDQDERFSRAAEELSAALGISKEEALAKLLQLK